MKLLALAIALVGLAYMAHDDYQFHRCINRGLPHCHVAGVTVYNWDDGQ